MSSEPGTPTSDASRSPESIGDVGAASEQLDGLLAALLPAFTSASAPAVSAPVEASPEPALVVNAAPSIAFRLLSSHAPRQIALEAPVIELKRPERQD